MPIQIGGLSRATPPVSALVDARWTSRERSRAAGIGAGRASNCRSRLEQTTSGVRFKSPPSRTPLSERLSGHSRARKSLRYPARLSAGSGMERVPSPKRPRSSRERRVEVLGEHEAAVQLLGDAGGGIRSGRFVSTIAGRAGALAVASPGLRVPASCGSQQRWKVLLQEW
jgi:hypothetical protein